MMDSKNGNKPHAKRCGAKTRSGEPCKNWAMPNGRCRMHGGKSTGPRQPEKMRKNKNAVKTGEYETIWLDTLDTEERELYNLINTDVLKQIEEELRLITIRERRMLQRIEKLRQSGDLTIVKHAQGLEKGKMTDLREREGTLGQIQAIEEALTRVQEKKARLLELKHKVTTEIGEGDGGNLASLAAVIRESAKLVKRHVQS